MDPFFAAAAAATVSAAAQRLADLGYENIRAQQEPNQITVWYENRRRADPLAALAEVLAAEAPLASPDVRIRAVPLSDDQPLLTVDTTAGAIAASQHGIPLEATLAPPLDPPPGPLASTAETTDVTIQPMFRFDPKWYALVAVAQAQAPIRSGLRLFAKAQGPVYPKLGFDPPLEALYTSGWMAPNLPAVFDVGFNGNFARIGGEAAYEIAGGYGLLKLRGGFAQDRFPELVGTAEAFLPWWDLALGGGWGTYELGDWGPFATLTRTFPRSQFSLGVYDSNYGVQFRGTLAIDFGPDPRPKPSIFRLIPFGKMQLPYAATAYQAAQLIEPGPDVEDFLDRLTPAYVQAHLDRLPWPKK